MARKARHTEHPWRKKCASGKLQYRSQDAAALAAKKLREKVHTGREYSCELCGQWHLTTKEVRP